jgi:hypothetical protein
VEPTITPLVETDGSRENGAKARSGCAEGKRALAQCSITAVGFSQRGKRKKMFFDIRFFIFQKNILPLWLEFYFTNHKTSTILDTMVLERPKAAQKTYNGMKPPTTCRQMPQQGHHTAENRLSLEKSAELMLNDYATDKELTAFTQLDGTPFYETR